MKQKLKNNNNLLTFNTIIFVPENKNKTNNYINTGMKISLEIILNSVKRRHTDHRNDALRTPGRRGGLLNANTLSVIITATMRYEHRDDAEGSHFGHSVPPCPSDHGVQIGVRPPRMNTQITF